MPCAHIVFTTSLSPLGGHSPPPPPHTHTALLGFSGLHLCPSLRADAGKKLFRVWSSGVCLLCLQSFMYIFIWMNSPIPAQKWALLSSFLR